MRPILIMPRPKVNEAAMADARRLNDLDAKRGAVELNEEGAVIDDLEERRTRWRRWCGLSEVIVMKSAEPSVPRPRKLEPPASLTNCENLIEMLLRRRRLSLPVRVRANSKAYIPRISGVISREFPGGGSISRETLPRARRAVRASGSGCR